ncbi:MAG: VWA domain-containing protein [Candidatus Obscuribacterales bacterium]|nr:VWA domain-containing protein [Candidatus Obscuribacterales bacterium]
MTSSFLLMAPCAFAQSNSTPATASTPTYAASTASTSATTMQTGASNSVIQASVEHESGPVNIMFLLDASYSMKEKLNGAEKKINAAKQVLETALARIPNDVNIGMRVFGQGYTGTGSDCFQTQLLVPLGLHNRNSIIQRTRTIEPFGLTPLAYALRQTVEEDFRYAQGAKTIILISDGADTCGADPCAFMRLLPRYGVKIKCDVVGLDVHHDNAARNQLNCIANATGGKYYDANTSGDLIDSVSQSVDKAISGRVIVKPGVPVKNTETGVDKTIEQMTKDGLKEGDKAQPAGSLTPPPTQPPKP